MARLFTRASSEFAENAFAVANTVPLTFACWFRSTDATVNQTLLSLGASASNNAFVMQAGGTTVNDPLQVASTVSGSSSVASVGTFLINTWHHAAGVYASSTSRTAFLDGTAGTANTTSSTPGGTINRTTVGRNSANSAGLPNYMSGRIAEAAMWAVALTATEIAALSRGLAPPFIRPDLLLGYWPLWGLHSPEIDLWSAPHLLTLTGTAAADHAPVVPFTRTRKQVLNIWEDYFPPFAPGPNPLVRM